MIVVAIEWGSATLTMYVRPYVHIRLMQYAMCRLERNNNMSSIQNDGVEVRVTQMMQCVDLCLCSFVIYTSPGIAANGFFPGRFALDRI